MRVIKTWDKDPRSTLDYSIDWLPWLPPGDAVATATWEVDGITVAAPPPSNTARFTTIWLQGGTASTDAYATCRVTTTAGRIDERTIRVRITNL